MPFFITCIFRNGENAQLFKPHVERQDYHAHRHLLPRRTGFQLSVDLRFWGRKVTLGFSIVVHLFLYRVGGFDCFGLLLGRATG